jgi:hypothetical protein
VATCDDPRVQRWLEHVTALSRDELTPQAAE